MKTKNEHLGTYITTYNGNYETTIEVTEEMAKEHKYYTSIGLGYLFEESTPKVKYKGVENEEKKRRMPRPKLIETPEKLMEIFEAYKAYCAANPRTKWVLSQKTAEMVAEPLRVPLTNEGFEIFCYNNYSDVHHYFDNTDNRYSEYRTICTHIKKEIRNDQITGGMVGQFNSSITQRLNALKEHTDVTSGDEKISAITVTIVK